MSTTNALAVVFGLLLGLGLWSLLAALPRFRARSLSTRIASNLADIVPEARRMTSHRAVQPLTVIGSTLAPVLAPLQRALGSVLSALFGGTERIAARLQRSGSTAAVAGYRTEQLWWGSAGLAFGAMLAVAIGVRGALPAVVTWLIPLLGALGGVIARDSALSRAVRRRQHRIGEELPSVLEFLTLSLSAGEGILAGLRRISVVSRGELAAEIACCCREVDTGRSLAHALTGLADRIDLPAVTRWVGQLVGALERGTPLAQVLRAQVGDVRVEARRELMESAGKKEIAMLVPLVFLILPATIAIAVFPGVIVLYSGF